MPLPGNANRPQLMSALVQQLEALERAGVTHLVRPGRGGRRGAAVGTPASSTPATAAPIRDANASSAPASSTSMPAASIAATQPQIPAEQIAAGSEDLDTIRREVSGCPKCAELCATRTQTVFGVGDPHARLVFVGEAPGADEDRQGEPFVGRAGQLLNKILEACHLSRSDVYILNVLKCRPPGNRTPLPDEVANCRGYLDRQLAVIRPETICCLGAVAARTLLEVDSPMSRLRGTFYNYRGIPVLCTYHPAYLLRNPAAKKDVWEDMKLLLGRLGLTC